MGGERRMEGGRRGRRWEEESESERKEGRERKKQHSSVADVVSFFVVSSANYAFHLPLNHQGAAEGGAAGGGCQGLFQGQVEQGTRTDGVC